MLVGVANVVDVHIVGTGSALRSAVICFYLSNEALSLFENAAHLGLPVPDKLRDILSQLHNRSDKEDKGDGANRRSVSGYCQDNTRRSFLYSSLPSLQSEGAIHPFNIHRTKKAGLATGANKKKEYRL